jgi:hypothetical protein
MKYFLIGLVILTACGGGLTEEQRKRIRNEMETSRIQKVSEAEIAEAAFARGRKIVSIINGEDRKRADSLAYSSANVVRFVTRESTNVKPIEDEIFDAYLEIEESGKLEDNIQTIRSDTGADSILYTYPVMTSIDGAPYLHGVWNIWMSKKELILSMQSK